VSDDDALATAHAAAEREGLLVGVSSGAAICAAVRIAEREEMAGRRILVIAPDGGERYTSLPWFAP
jgi:cysteine synthase A